MEKRTSLFENGLIWFGAGVSIAEILTGTYFAALGFGRGLAAILVGHVIGCTAELLFEQILDAKHAQIREEVINSELIVRESSDRSFMQ